MQLKGLFLFLLIVIIFISCQPKQAKKEPATPDIKPVLETPALPTLPDSAFVQVSSENVRLEPNGTTFGMLQEGEKIYVMGRIGNWILFHNSRFDSVFVWGPSVGFDYINLHSPYAYFDTTTKRFYPIDYIRKLFSKSGKKQDINNENYQLFFSKLGLGSHQETVMEVTEKSSETIKHGIRIYLRKQNNEIYKIEADFLNPVKGAVSALEQCELTHKNPDQNDEAFLLWKRGNLVPGLSIKLERTEWKSEQFRTVWFLSK